MKSTREKILQTLLAHPRATVTDLAVFVGINPISVRHHLTSLAAQGLISSEDVRHGIGRPRQVFYLSPAGMERFPTNYLKLATRILDQMKSTLPAPVVEKLFTEIALDLSSEYQTIAQQLSLEEKLELVQRLLSREGFNVTLEQDGDTYRINENSCPYLHVGQAHPEICNVDQTLIASILSAPVSKVECVLHGNDHCTYVLQKSSLMEQNK